MKERIDLPDIKDIEALDTQSAHALLKQLIMLISTLYSLIETLNKSLADAQTQREQERVQREQLQRMLFGSKSERVIPIARQVRNKNKETQTPEDIAKQKEAAKKKRAENAEKRRESLATQVVLHPIEDSCCDCCGQAIRENTQPLADEVSEEYEYIPSRLVRREHRRERAVCSCGNFVYGEAVRRVADNVLYGPGLHAHVVVSKCADSLPVDRQARIFQRSGAPISKSSLNDVFHRSADLFEPIYRRMLEKVAASSHVSADETTLKVQQKKVCRTAWMWTFIANDLVTYVYSASRNGATPMAILGDTTGVLTVDGYSGYNQVTCPESRTRSGCWAHARRKFFEARNTAPEEAQFVIDQILEIYRVEYDAAAKQVIGTQEHKAMRQARSKDLVDKLYHWFKNVQAEHLPKSPMGQAIGYALKQKDALQVFLDDEKVPIDNNLSERHLRLIALGRKNFLFVGNDVGGQNLAILQSLVSSCIANQINPQAYLSDVIMRVQDHPQSAIDELLPDQWQPSE
jgi:transposase